MKRGFCTNCGAVVRYFKKTSVCANCKRSCVVYAENDQYDKVRGDEE